MLTTKEYDHVRSSKNGILIVGAGLAGLSPALALANHGIQGTVVEKQKEIAPSKWTIFLYPLDSRNSP